MTAIWKDLISIDYIQGSISSSFKAKICTAVVHQPVEKPKLRWHEIARPWFERLAQDRLVDEWAVKLQRFLKDVNLSNSHLGEDEILVRKIILINDFDPPPIDAYNLTEIPASEYWTFTNVDAGVFNGVRKIIADDHVLI